MKDAAFIEEARKQSLDLEPLSGAELQRIVAEILAAPKPVIERLAKLIEMPGSGSSPKR